MTTRRLERSAEFAFADTSHVRVMLRSDLCTMSDSPELQAAAGKAAG